MSYILIMSHSGHRKNNVSQDLCSVCSHSSHIGFILFSFLPFYPSFLLCTMRQEGLLFVGCLTSQQHASVSQGRICSDKCTCYHTEAEVADPIFYLTQSQHTDTGPTYLSTDPVAPGAWHGSLLERKLLRYWCDSTRKNPHASGRPCKRILRKPVTSRNRNHADTGTTHHYSFGIIMHAAQEVSRSRNCH